MRIVLLTIYLLTGFLLNGLGTLSFAVGEETTKGSKPSEFKQQLEEITKGAAKQFPAEVIKTMDQAIETVRATGIEKSAKQVGDAAVDAELVGWNGKTTRLSSLWKDGPIVLMWYRGGWCPYCNIQLRAMQKKIKAIEGAGAKLVVLTPELPNFAKETAKANDIDFVALHDKDNETARKYGIVFQIPKPLVPMYKQHLNLAKRNGTDAMELPLSATYVINKGGKISYAFLDANYANRAEPAEVVAAVRKLAGPPKAGDTAMDFELKTIGGKPVKLSDAVKDGPTIVMVLRGFPGYQCPICTRQVGRFIGKTKAFAAKKAQVILVYPGPAKVLNQKAREFMDGTELPKNFTLVLDPDYVFTNAYSLRWNAPRETAYPSTFVIGQDMKIDFAKISNGHGGRTDPKEVLKAIK